MKLNRCFYLYNVEHAFDGMFMTGHVVLVNVKLSKQSNKHVVMSWLVPSFLSKDISPLNTDCYSQECSRVFTCPSV